jgi:ornithine carbamoyltransferase
MEMAKYASIPVINGLSDFSHPCQALADVYTVKEKLGDIKGVTLAYIGDGNNVCNSLIFAAGKAGLKINIASPKGYEPDKSALKQAKNHASLFHSPAEAVKGADIIYTDVWASMGQEKETEKRKKIFKKFQVNSELAHLAKKNALIMHCLPAHRGEEITDKVIDSKNSIVFDQAENRMHVQKAILIKLLGA